jgi:hypothetical protein
MSLSLKKKEKSFLFSLFFGVGELALLGIVQQKVT